MEPDFPLPVENEDGTTSYPLTLLSEARQWPEVETRSLLTQNGVSVDVNGTTAHLRAPSDARVFCDALLALSLPQIQNFMLPLTSAPETFSDIVDVACAIKRLENKCAAPDPAYPLADMTDRPFTLPFDAALHARFQDHLATLAREHGIEMRMGAEFEFVLGDPPEIYQDTCLTLASALYAAERDAFKTARDAASRQHHGERLLAMQSFRARDFVMLHLLEHAPLTRDVFEHAFGTSGAGNGYYDNDQVLEFRTRVLSADTFFERYHGALAHVLRTVYANRIPIREAENSRQHLSLSFWREGRNILLCETPDDRALCEKLVNAFGSALEDGFALLLPPRFITSSAPTQYIVGPSRHSFVRHAYGRLEIRSFCLDAQHLVIGALMAAGALTHALSHDTPAPTKARAHMVAGVSLPEQGLPWFRHALNASVIDPANGHLIPDDAYITASATKILQQINPRDPSFSDLPKDDPDHPYSVPACPDAHIAAVSTLVAHARVYPDVDGGWRITWPAKKIALSENTAIRCDRLNVARVSGVTPRFTYPMPESPEASFVIIAKKLEQHPVIRTIFGGELIEKLTFAFVAADPENGQRGALLATLVHGLADALRSPEREDDGNGYRLLTIPLQPRPAAQAKVALFDAMHTLRRCYPDVFGPLHLRALLLKDGTDQTEALQVLAPLAIEQDITFAITHISAALEKGKGSRQAAPHPSV